MGGERVEVYKHDEGTALALKGAWGLGQRIIPTCGKVHRNRREAKAVLKVMNQFPVI